ncbi:MAG: SIS domain-containing protein [Calditrichaeota bacterium]|nr:MAG: SIS domain-containing protein [Calditrichota bacterium]
MPNSFSDTLNAHRAVIDTLNALESELETIISQMTDTLRNGGKILLAGNGGSAADAQHIAAELIIRLTKNLQRPALPALALTTDSSILSAAGNDIGFENVFARQVEGLARAEDLLWLISTSGQSENLLRAARAARANRCRVFGLLGNDGGALAPLCDWTLIVPARSTQHIQEAHMVLYHYLCERIENDLYA